MLQRYEGETEENSDQSKFTISVKYTMAHSSLLVWGILHLK